MQVSKPGSVKVEKLMNVERYSHVMHISSTVSFFFLGQFINAVYDKEGLHNLLFFIRVMLIS